MFQRICKPWFLYRPATLVRRALVAIRPPSGGYLPISTAWGVPIVADPARMIGRSLLTTGVYDLAVSEALARLISPGETVIDAGANVGYMTILASLAAGPTGRVIAFEPHPDLFAILQRNIAATQTQFATAPTDPHASALGDQPGTATLQLPPDFGANDGIARVGIETIPGGTSIRVPVETLDNVLGEGSAAVLKLDVEGFEPEVLQGASRALNGHRIRHIVFEDHQIEGSKVAQILRSAGYHLFALGWKLRGPAIEPVEGGRLASDYEAPNYLATLDPADLLARCRPRGWRVLSERFADPDRRFT